MGITIIYKKDDVLNNLTKAEKEILRNDSAQFWMDYCSNREHINYADSLSNYIEQKTGKKFAFKMNTANAISSKLNLI
jgi:hypothetical protein